MNLTEIIINDKIVFGGQQMPVIAGPCVIENRDHTLKLAEAIQKITDDLKLPFIFKSSFDKANRTSIDSYRGPGLEKGLEILNQVKTILGIPVLTDIHEQSQVPMVAEVADILQIPAFLCRQTDLILAAGESHKPVNIKRGQFLSPGKMGSVVKKIESTGNKKIILTERGSLFGHDSLITDLRSIPIMQKFGYPVIFDATHSAQMPGTGGQNTGGLREFIPIVARGAVAAGCNGIFLEVHDQPGNALSDTATQWPLDQLKSLLKKLKDIFEVVQ